MKSFILVGLVVLFGSANAFAGDGQCLDGKCLLAPVKAVHNGLVAVVESKPVQFVGNTANAVACRTMAATKRVASRPLVFKRRCR